MMASAYRYKALTLRFKNDQIAMELTLVEE